MARSPHYKVFTPEGKYVAACKYAEDAAMVVAGYGRGSTIRNEHAVRNTLYVDGIDGFAADSVDQVAAHVHAAELEAKR